MRLPRQATSIERSPFTSAPASNGVTPSGGTCACSGAPGGCSTQIDNCSAGFYAVCAENLYACGCSCAPIGT